MKMAIVAAIFSACFLTALALDWGPVKTNQMVQDGIYLDVRGQEEPNIIRREHNIIRRSIELRPAEIKHNVIDHLEVPMTSSLLETRNVCEDVAAEHTGFDVNDANGWVKHASCDDLQQHCHEHAYGEQVRVACPVSCFLCTPGGDDQADKWHGPCFDAVNSGIRFRDGPKAHCADLINYCNHTAIGQQVKEACKLSCGMCAIHVEGPYMDAYGQCQDLSSHEEPKFTISGQIAGCADVAQFCQSHPDSYLIRHKCPLTCGVCGNPTSTEAPVEEVETPGDTGGCDRRRRWGFCSTRRRRNI